MWRTIIEPPNLSRNQAHLWKIDTREIKDVSVYWSFLSENEKSRADKFVFERDRKMYVVGRVTLRKLLGDYLQIDPSEIEFKYNDYGKPSVESVEDIRFNISHSHGMIVLGFTLNKTIGVDVEYNKRPIEIEDVATRFFSKNECQDLLSIKEEDRRDAFYNCWTRKEALIKAMGGGLSIPLDQFEVTLTPSCKPQLKVMKWDQDDVKQWKMEAYCCDEDYTGAVIVRNKNTEYFYFEFQQQIPSVSIMTNDKLKTINGCEE